MASAQRQAAVEVRSAQSAGARVAVQPEDRPASLRPCSDGVAALLVEQSCFLCAAADRPERDCRALGLVGGDDGGEGLMVRPELALTEVAAAAAAATCSASIGRTEDRRRVEWRGSELGPVGCTSFREEESCGWSEETECWAVASEEDKADARR